MRHKQKYDRLAPLYNSIMWIAGVACGGGLRWRETILNALKLRQGDMVLDVGCGTGELTAEIARLLGSPRQVVGVEPSFRMLLRAKQRPIVPTYLAGKAEALPFRDATFDKVVCCLALHEVAGPQRMLALEETKRVLKPGGLLAVADLTPPHAGVVCRVIFRIILSLERLVDAAGIRSYLSVGLDGLLAQLGLREIHREGIWLGCARLVVLNREQARSDGLQATQCV